MKSLFLDASAFEGQINILLSALILLFFSFLQACLTYFLYYAMTPGQIFAFYKKWLDAFFIPKNGMPNEKPSFWYKPLGGCAACMNIWLALAGFWGVEYAIGFAPSGAFIIVWWLAYAVTANLWLAKMW